MEVRHLFIINPKAGKRDRSSEYISAIEAAMSGLDKDYETVLTEYAGHAKEIIRTRLQSGDEYRVYACGGDGTLNEVVNGAAGFPNAAVTQFPCGTGNDFVRLFEENMPRFLDFPELINGEERRLDLIEADGAFSLNICSVGMDARVANDVHIFSKLPGVGPSAAFNISALYNTVKGIYQQYKITIDGERHDGLYSLAVAANARYYGGGYKPIPQANPADGLLDFLLVRNMSRFHVLRFIRLYSMGQYERMGDKAAYFQGREMLVESVGKPCVMNMDGETRETDRISFRLVGGGIRFFGPAGCFDFLDK